MAAASSGCTVGSGVGTAGGNVTVFSCMVPVPFDLSPHFFAGEPVDDISDSAIAENRLTIRLSRNGTRPEINDNLYFDIQSAYEIARCIRGRVNKDGTPDWDAAGGWCDWTGGQGGTVQAARPRILIGPELPVQASLSLLYTCSLADTVGDGVEGSWIDFETFGDVAQPNVPPAMRAGIDGGFKVDFGSRLSATFNLVLDDERRIHAKKVMDPIPAPHISGQMSGAFDFDLERGRAAQAFP